MSIDSCVRSCSVPIPNILFILILNLAPGFASSGLIIPAGTSIDSPGIRVSPHFIVKTFIRMNKSLSLLVPA